MRLAFGDVIGQLQVCARHEMKITPLSQNWDTSAKTVTAMLIMAPLSDLRLVLPKHGKSS